MHNVINIHPHSHINYLSAATHPIAWHVFSVPGNSDGNKTFLVFGLRNPITYVLAILIFIFLCSLRLCTLCNISDRVNVIKCSNMCRRVFRNKQDLFIWKIAIAKLDLSMRSKVSEGRKHIIPKRNYFKIILTIFTYFFSVYCVQKF